MIANSEVLGVWIQGGAGNSVLSNSIYNTGQLGIDLWSGTDSSNGVTLNDAGDADSGANNLQNYPLIATAISGTGQTIVSGTLQSTRKAPRSVSNSSQAVRPTPRDTAKVRSTWVSSRPRPTPPATQASSASFRPRSPLVSISRPPRLIRQETPRNLRRTSRSPPPARGA